MNNAAAIILTPNDTASAAKKTSRLLEFFGVPSRRAGVEEFWPAARAAVSRLVIFCSPEIFRQLQLDRQTDSACEALWQEQVASAFVHGDGAAELAAALGQSEVVECRSEIFSVAEGPNDLCGVMAGVRCPVAAEHFSGVRAVKSASGAAIIANAEGAIFLQLEVSGVPVFFSTAPKLVNLDAPLPALSPGGIAAYLTMTATVLGLLYAVRHLATR